MNGRQLGRIDGVERAQDVQLAVRIRRGVTQGGNLNIHSGAHCK